jgi:hypothetical protein
MAKMRAGRVLQGSYIALQARPAFAHRLVAGGDGGGLSAPSRHEWSPRVAFQVKRNQLTLSRKGPARRGRP